MMRIETTVVFTLLAVVSGFLAVRARNRGRRIQLYVFKPLTMVFILLMAVTIGGLGFSLYGYAILAGLVCSLIGDVFLMLPGDRFLGGLVGFLVAHLFYIVAFIGGGGFSLSVWILLPVMVCGFVVFRILLPYLGRMKLPVLVYVVVIVVMVWQAWERWYRLRQMGALLACFGAVLFLISDSALAVNRFRGKFENAQTLILSTYFSAQWLIALSLGGFS